MMVFEGSKSPIIVSDSLYTTMSESILFHGWCLFVRFSSRYISQCGLCSNMKSKIININDDDSIHSRLQRNHHLMRYNLEKVLSFILSFLSLPGVTEGRKGMEIVSVGE